MIDRGENSGVVEMEEKLKSLRQRCRSAGLRVTPQRIAVYRALVETTGHPSAETVFRSVRTAFPNISLDTVNRTLLTLNEIGAAFIVEGSGDAKRYDANMAAHQHFRCVRCKLIMDLCLDPVVEFKTPASLDGFTVLKKTVYLEGICGYCMDAGN